MFETMSPSSGARNVKLIFFKMMLMHELIWDLHGAGLIYIIEISSLVCSFSSLLAPSCIINLQCQLLVAVTCLSNRKLLMTSMCVDGFGWTLLNLDFLRFTWKSEVRMEPAAIGSRNINQVMLMKSIGTDGAAGFCVRINQIQPCEIHPEVGCQQKAVCIMIVGLP